MPDISREKHIKSTHSNYQIDKDVTIIEMSRFI
jgi:hypothetical protein